MTDTSAARGGVGIRLYTSGGDVVKRTFDSVGDSGRKMWAEIALGEKAANPAIRALSVGVNEAKVGVDALAGRTGSAGLALGSFGAAGVAVAATLGGVVLALGQARNAMSFADEMDDAAQKLNIGVEALQEYRYAMTAVGGATTDADTAIDGFQKKLGEAGAGGKSMKWFERLGFSQDDLKAFPNTEVALDAVLDKIANLGTEAQRAAVSEKLGLGPMVSLARLGSDGLRQLRQDAQDLGIVMDAELVKKGADANQQFETMSAVIDVQLKSALVDLGPVLVSLMQLVAGLGRGLNSLADSWRRMDQRSTEGLRAQAQQLAERREFLTDLAGPNPNMFQRDAIKRLSDQRAGIQEELRRRASRQAIPTPPPGNLIDLDTPRGGGGRRPVASNAAIEAKREEDERQRATETLGRDLTTARRDVTRQRWDGDTPEERAQLAKSLLALDQQERDAKRATLRAELERTNGLSEAVKIQLDQLGYLDQESDDLANKAIVEDQRRETAQRALENEQTAAEDSIALLEIQDQMAQTGADRFKIGRKILLAEQELERKVLDAAIRADGFVTDEEKRHYDAVIERQQGDLKVYDFNEEDRLRKQFKSAGQEVVQAIEDGRIGDMIADRLKSRFLDMALNGLFDMIGGGKKESGGFLSSLVNFGANVFMKKASGGYVSGSGGPREDNIPAFLSNGEYVINAEATKRMRPLLDRINAGHMDRFAMGGVAGMTGTPETGPEESLFV